MMDSSWSCRMECMSKVSFHEIHYHICSMRELTKEERDMYIIGKLKSRSTSSVSSRHNVKNLLKHMKTIDIRPWTLWNSGKKPHNALFFEEIKFVVQFIKRNFEVNGLPMSADCSKRKGHSTTNFSTLFKF